MAAGRSGLLHATTGSGKTYAVWFGALARAAPSACRCAGSARLRSASSGSRRCAPSRPIRARAIAGAARRSRHRRWTLGIRTGDTRAGRARAQDRRFPTALVTTPGSLSLMLTREQRARRARRRAHRDRRRVARADGQQARRAGAARARPPEALEPGPRRLGTVGDARQPRRGDAGAARPRATARWCAAGSTRPS